VSRTLRAVRTDQIRSVREAREAQVVAIDAKLGEHEASNKHLIARGRMADFRCTYGWIEDRDGGIALDPDCAKVLGVGPGDTVTHVARW
jgi:arginine N-succinyltransferase